MNKPTIILHALGECPYSQMAYEYGLEYENKEKSICDGMGKWIVDPFESEIYNKIKYKYFCDGGYGERCLEV